MKVEKTFYCDFISKTVDWLIIISFITKNAQIIDIWCIYAVKSVTNYALLAWKSSSIMSQISCLAFIVIYPVSIIFLVCHIFCRSGYIMWKIGFKRNSDHWKCSHLINEQTTSSQLYLIVRINTNFAIVLILEGVSFVRLFPHIPTHTCTMCTLDIYLSTLNWFSKLAPAKHSVGGEWCSLL